MSHYVEAALQMKNIDWIAGALQLMGLPKEKILRDTEARGYYRNQTRACELVVRRGDTRALGLNSYADLGFQKDSQKGTVKVLHDSMDHGWKDFEKNLKKAYAETGTRAVARQNGWTIQDRKVTKEGKVVLQVLV